MTQLLEVSIAKRAALKCLSKATRFEVDKHSGGEDIHFFQGAKRLKLEFLPLEYANDAISEAEDKILEKFHRQVISKAKEIIEKEIEGSLVELTKGK